MIKKMLDHTPAISACMTEKFILIETFYGCSAPSLDPDAPRYLLPPESGDIDLGQAVLKALSASRPVTLEELPVLFDIDGICYKRMEEIHKKNTQDDMKKFGYKTKRSFFMNMKYITAYKLNGMIEFYPTRHGHMDSWIRYKNDNLENVIIPSASSTVEVGAALRLAFSRCI